MCNEKIKIRKVIDMDISVLKEIDKSVYEDKHLHTDFCCEIKKKEALILCACYDIISYASPFGYIHLWYFNDEAQLMSIAVQKDMQRHAVGTALLLCALQLLHKEDCKNIYLEVRKSNFGAIGLYEKHGFKKIGIRRGYYQDPLEDALVYIYST